MENAKLEYIWLDGYEPEPSMRGKTKIIAVEDALDVKLDDCPEWSFDGSSTQQAEGNASDCLLKPVAIYPDVARHNGHVVLCEVLDSEGKHPPVEHARNVG